MSLTKTSFIFLTALLIFFSFEMSTWAKSGEEYWTIPNYDKFSPTTIAVMPFDNFSLDPDVEISLNEEVYNRLAEKGYVRVLDLNVREIMGQLGVKFAGQLEAFSSESLARHLHCDGILLGQIDQSAHINQVGYDAVVVSCSLRLKDLRSGKILWRADQWRTAHRQWQLDPLNALLNFTTHKMASRKERVAYLVSEMLQTLPQGKVKISDDLLMQHAVEVKAEVENE